MKENMAKFKWLRDFEKVFAIHIAFGFWWVLCWFGITWIVQKWINLPTDNVIINILGMSALVGFVFIMGRGLIILVIGLTKDLIKPYKQET